MTTGAFTFTTMERVIYGRPASDEIVKEASRLGAERVFILASGSLNRNTDEIAKVRDALGSKFVGLADDMPAHTPRDAVVRAAVAAAAVDADLLVSFGGGSATDGGKVMRIAMEHGITEAAGLDPYPVRTDADGKSHIPTYRPPRVPQICVPTTLSGGEFNPLGGCTDPVSKLKQGYRLPELVPATVILDPAPTIHTPEWLWLSTGIRAVDHAVESLCSVRASPYTDGTAMHALRLLQRGLSRVKQNANDLDARLDCQIGAWLSMAGVVAGVPMGASHGIGHVLGGTCDVPHGYTSCIMLPAVMRWNRSVNAERQALVAEALGRPGDDAGDVLDDFIGGLGLPRRLSDVDIGPDQFALVAKNAMHDRWIHTNPRPIGSPDDVIEILQTAA